MKIELKNVSKFINNNVILNDINLSLESGKIYGFIGRNGSGKTMLFNIICGFVNVTEGQVIINNLNITKEKIFSKDIRALIENPKFIPNLSGYKNLKLLASINNIVTNQEIENVLKEVGLFEEKDKLYSKYSLGMKQKLGIAQVLMENPKIMIFDEPFNGLDDESTKKIRKILLAQKKEGKLILIATHIKEDIENLCDVIYKLDNGKIINR